MGTRSDPPAASTPDDGTFEPLSALAAERDRYREALEFYADPSSYENATPRTVRPVITDQGARARKALA